MQKLRINPFSDALIIIDVQPTFMPGGGLPVPGGNVIIPVIKKAIYYFSPQCTVATLDKHPSGHISLASSYIGAKPMDVLRTADNVRLAPHAKFTWEQLKEYLSKVGNQILWPNHGVIGTGDAELHPLLKKCDIGFFLEKGTDPACDSYSAFFDNLGRPTGLARYLREHGAKRCFFVGLAFDYCVGWSALDAVKENFEAFVIKEATRAVGSPADSVRKILEAFKKAKINMVKISDLVL